MFVPLGTSDKDVRQEKVREEFMAALRIINHCGEEVKRLQQREGDDTAKRAALFRRLEDKFIQMLTVNASHWSSCRAMSNAPGESGSTSTSSNYGVSAGPATPATKRAPVYRRSLSLEQSQNMKEAEVYFRTPHGVSNFVLNLGIDYSPSVPTLLPAT